MQKQNLIPKSRVWRELVRRPRNKEQSGSKCHQESQKELVRTPHLLCLVTFRNQSFGFAGGGGRAGGGE